ncbi:MAG TPA: pyridoxamine 5'-phosphate oxidase [Caulobacteraceae bacterium]|jgi:pyridoxamine 5'-phosphate oxidase|nr:pyridoxamine 5'-phosphate oxidase [Caulobacteraceae bacterium]
MTTKPTPSENDDFFAAAAKEPPLPDAAEPLVLFDEWMRAAEASEPNDPNAMALATVDAHGLPDMRMVLLKGVDARGFVFYTNTESAKGVELGAAPKAGLLFHWKSLRRQVRVRGPVEPVSAEEADAYFASRPRGSQIGAWASDQSRPLPDRLALERRVAEFGLRFGIGKVARPPHWSGYRVLPTAIEFWRDRPFRLHERLAFSRQAPDAAWTVARLYP